MAPGRPGSGLGGDVWARIQVPRAFTTIRRTGPAPRSRLGPRRRHAAREGATRVQGKSESRDMGLKIHVYKVAAGVAARPQLCQQLAANPNPRETSDGLRLPWSSPATSTVLTSWPKVVSRPAIVFAAAGIPLPRTGSASASPVMNIILAGCFVWPPLLASRASSSNAGHRGSEGEPSTSTSNVRGCVPDDRRSVRKAAKLLSEQPITARCSEVNEQPRRASARGTACSMRAWRKKPSRSSRRKCALRSSLSLATSHPSHVKSNNDGSWPTPTIAQRRMCDARSSSSAS